MQNEPNGEDRHGVEGQSPVLDYRGKGLPRRRQKLSHRIIFIVFWSIFAVVVVAAFWRLPATPRR